MEEVQIKSGREEVNREVNEPFEGTVGHTTCTFMHVILFSPLSSTGAEHWLCVYVRVSMNVCNCVLLSLYTVCRAYCIDR